MKMLSLQVCLGENCFNGVTEKNTKFQSVLQLMYTGVTHAV